MAKTCGAQYILKDCQCLADPFDRYSTLCGYIDKVDGLLYGCDTGCCFENCDNLNKIPVGLENRPSAGVSLPPGYGVNLPTSSTANPVGAPFVTAGPSRSLLNDNVTTGPLAKSFPIWKLLLIAILPLVLVAILSCFL